MQLLERCLDPSLISPKELKRLSELVFEDERPALVGAGGVRIALPDPIYHLLVRTVQAMNDGKTIVLLPHDETFTTQAAADFLGMSRQFFVGLLEQNVIPHHKVGTHRRVYLRDLLGYQKRRDVERRTTLNKFFGEADKAGVYDSELPPEDEG